MRKILLCLVFICIGICAYADETCDQSLIEAKQKYNAGNYAKAKALFEFVRDECGSNYGDVNSWISKCNSALNPSLSLSRSSISFGASSNTSSISVTSNRDWNVRSSGATWFTTSVSGNTINVSCSSNSSSSRSSYFDVITSDGAKSVRVSVSQSGSSSSLSVSRTALNVSSGASTEYLTVTSNTAWEIQYPSATMYSVTRSGNSLTVSINANTTGQSRSDFFNVKTTDGSKVVKVTINQSAKAVSNSSYNASASIDKVWVDHNVYQNSVKGMKIHVKFNVYNMLGCTGRVSAYFYYDNNQNTPLKDYNQNFRTADGNVSCGKDFTPGYTNCVYEDLEIFMPYNELHCTNTGKYELKFFLSVWSDHNVELKQSNWVKFTLTN